MSKKKLVFLTIIVVETLLFFIAFTGYLQTKQSLEEAIELNQELLDNYAEHNNKFHCNLQP